LSHPGLTGETAVDRAGGPHAIDAATGAGDVRSVALVLQSTALGGMEAHCRYHAAELVRRGLRVSVIVPRDAAFDELAGAVRREGCAVARLDTDARRGRLRQLAGAIRLWRLVRSARADVVHLHTGGATGGLLTVAVARLARATVVVTEHDVPAGVPRARDRRARRLLDRLAHCVVAVSRRNAGLRLAALGPTRARLASVPNGVPVPAPAPGEVERNRREVRARLDIPAGAFVAGSLVRLAPGKGLPDLLRAFALLEADGPAVLLLVGEGPMRDELSALARDLGVADRVRFAGHQPAAAPFLDAMDAFVLAVPAGSMSIALLEAMARGLPPVITFCGPEEAVVGGRTGLCAPPGDPVGLAGALDRLARGPELRRRLGEQAAAYVRERFSAARVADDLLAVYRVRARGLPERLRA
jgi:glycosyltransferase involved in cell wall biosynthesis